MSAQPKEDAPLMPFYMILSDRPFHKVRDREKCSSYKALESNPNEVRARVKDEYPLAIAHARLNLLVTEDMLSEMVIATSDAEGTFITADPEVARAIMEGFPDRGVQGIKQICPSARFHPNSMKLPDRKAKVVKS